MLRNFKSKLIVAFLAFIVCAFAMAQSDQQTYRLLNAVTTTGAGPSVTLPAMTPIRATSVSVTGTGSVSATVVLRGSTDCNAWATIATFTLSGTGFASDGFVNNAPWPCLSANVTAISGTGASVNAAVAR